MGRFFVSLQILMYTRISQCRLCQTDRLETILSLGFQALTGLFPKKDEPDVATAPLELVKCPECHLVQLAHNFELSNLYGETYGYRSGLNQSMVRHLGDKVARALSVVPLEKGDVVLDIGSNDGTTLGHYPEMGLRRVGMDPSAQKFKHFYKPGIELIVDFFSAKKFLDLTENRKARIVTSIAMFYDLEAPQEFVNQIAQVLDTNGIWIFEQSYLPAMLDSNGYDTICHEHLEYYALSQILRMLDRAGLKLVDIEHNDVNGGSFSLTAAKKESNLPECESKIKATLLREKGIGLHTETPYNEFKKRIESHRKELQDTLASIKNSGLTLLGYGASTKGNVLLQYCGFTAKDIPVIAEVNPDKFGARTPGSAISIVSEEEARKKNPDVFFVLPWHFRDSILKREKTFLERGGALLFPLPNLELVTAERSYSGRELSDFLKAMKTVSSRGVSLHT